MEHIIIKDLEDDYKLLKPEKGYRLYNIITQRFYSEAVVKDINGYIAIKE